MNKILMFLIDKSFEFKVKETRVLLASTDKYIFSMHKVGNYWNIELIEFDSNFIRKRITKEKILVKDVYIFLTEKIK